MARKLWQFRGNPKIADQCDHRLMQTKKKIEVIFSARSVNGHFIYICVSFCPRIANCKIKADRRKVKGDRKSIFIIIYDHPHTHIRRLDERFISNSFAIVTIRLFYGSQWACQFNANRNMYASAADWIDTWNEFKWTWSKIAFQIQRTEKVRDTHLAMHILCFIRTKPLYCHNYCR